MKHTLEDSELKIQFEHDILSGSTSRRVDEVNAIIDEFKDKDVQVLKLNMSEVKNIDSNGLNSIVSFYHKSVALNWTLKLYGACPQVLRLLKFSGLSGKITIMPLKSEMESQ